MGPGIHLFIIAHSEHVKSTYYELDLSWVLEKQK